MTVSQLAVAGARRPIRLGAVARPHVIAGCASLVLLATVLGLRMNAAGSPMDEGGLLAYGDRILHGELPMRDLHSFYGPLSTFLVAGAFKIAGPGLYAERALGLLYRLVLTAALLGLVRRRGVPALIATTLLLLWLVPSQGDAAFSTWGALAFACTAILLADTGRPFTAGLLAGVAVLMRFDWALPLALAAIPYLGASPRRTRIRLLAGGAAGLLPYAPYLALVGLHGLRLVADGIRSGQANRHLPVSVAPHGDGLLLDLMLLSIVLLAASGFRLRRTGEGLMLLSGALLGLGLLPYALDRADRQHILVGVIVPLVLLTAAMPAPVADLLRRRCVARVAAPAAAVTVGVAVFSSLLGSNAGATVSFESRSFRLTDASIARAASLAVARAAALAPSGGRLFVGPTNLRVTNYSDAYVYYLLPALRPATFYITLDPGATDLPGERLADGLRSADVLILNSAYSAGQRGEALGSAEPNRVVVRDYCLRGRYPPFRVFTRCRG